MENNRRSFMTGLGKGAAVSAVALAAPAVIASEPNIKWRLSSSFPKILDTIYGNADDVVQKVAEITDGKFQIEVNAPGSIVGPFDNLEAAQKGSIEVAHTAPYYFFNKDPVYTLDCAIPWGMNQRHLNAWYNEGNGRKLFREFYAERGLVQIASGNTGAQMGGWFRKEIKSMQDVAGLRMRIAGLAGEVMKSLGVLPQSLPGAQLLSKFEAGELDAAEWVGPYDDEKMGLNKVAPYYYYPGFWEGSTQVAFLMNKKAWDGLPKRYQAALEAACAYGNSLMLAKYDARNGPALQRLIKSGTKMRSMPQPILDASYRSAMQLYSDLGSKNVWWKKIYTDYRGFHKDITGWFRYTENTYDTFASRLMVK